MSITARHIAAVFEKIAPIASGIEGDELGFVFGDPDTEIKAMACVWQVHAASIEAAARAGVNFLLCHESIWLPPQSSAWYFGPGRDQIFSNNLRRELLQKHGMVVYRSHSNWDALPVDGVPDQAVASLALGELQVVGEQKFFKVHRLPVPMTVADLASRVHQTLIITPRVFGDQAKMIQNFAFLIGGFGENQWHMPQAARNLGAEAIIIGEMSEFIVSASLEMGLPVIETLHSMSESPSIFRQAQLMAGRLPELPVYFIVSGALSWGDHAQAALVKGST
jgi:putative NIF3 family GTP cyclohydrolase 1 type 2